VALQSDLAVLSGAVLHIARVLAGGGRGAERAAQQRPAPVHAVPDSPASADFTGLPVAPLPAQSLAPRTSASLRTRWWAESDDEVHAPEPEMEGLPEQQQPDLQAPDARGDSKGDASGLGPNVTTLMIRNVPSDVTREQLLTELNRSGFKGLFDFCYVPTISFETGHGKGFAFVNFITEAAAASFAGAWRGSRRFGVVKPDPALNISAAALQGKRANLAKWSKKRAARIRDPRYQPFVRED